MESGARGGARLTTKTYRLGVIGNDGLWSVGDEYKTGASVKESGLKYLRDECTGTARDAKNVSDAVITSKPIRKAIKEAYDWTGIYGAATAALGGGLGYLAFLDGDNELGWLKGPMATALIGSVYKLATKIEKKYKEYKEERQRVGEELKKIKGEYFGLLKEIMKSGLSLDDRINLKYYVGVDQFSKGLAENKKKLKERADHAKNMRCELGCMETYAGRFMEEMEKTGMNDKAKYTNKVSGEAQVCEASL